MKTRPFWAGLLCLVACAPATDDTEIERSEPDTEESDTEVDSENDSESDTEDIDADCPWSLTDVDNVYPADGAENIWVSPTFDEVQADVSDLSGAIATVQTTDGTEVAGSSTITDGRVVWTPTAGSLVADTRYDFIITSERCALVVSTFTTISDAPVSFGADRTYVLDWSTAQGEAAFITETLFDSLGLALWRFDADEFQLVPTEDNEQDLCLPTTGALTTYDAPELFLFRVTQPLVDADDPVYLVQADIRAVADGSDSELVNVHVTGFLDFTEAPDFDLCDVVDAFGLSCVPCPDQPSNQCLPIDLYGIRAPADTQFSPADVDEFNAFECDGVG